MDNNNMKYITILDFEEGKVYQYSINYESYFISDHEDFCPYETFMESKGHRTSNCEWMIHEKPGVEFNIQ